MKRRVPPLTNNFLATLFRECLAIAVVLIAASQLHAADRFWISNSGTSNFNATANWSTTSGGGGGASVPAATDTANFTLSGTYTVDFVGSSNPTNTAVDVEAGSVTFDLSGQTYTLSNLVRVGVTGGASSARLTLFDGTLDVDTNGDNIEVGTTDADGFLTVSTHATVGAGGTNPDIILGSSGDGSLTINNGGVVNSTSGQFGVASALATGTATVTGLGSRWTNSGGFIVGSSGSGSLVVQSGATISGSGSQLGSGGGSIGTATITGTGSSWTEAASFTVGNFGTGTLNISNGGEMSIASSAFVAGQGNSNGTVNVSGSGSTWTIGADLAVGNLGNGTVSVLSGGQVTANAVRLGVLSSASTKGTLNISGSGSKLTANGAFQLGVSAPGTATISNGGTLVTGADATFAVNSTGSGDLTVTGDGSLWENTGNILLGLSGSGTLTVSNGATVTTTGELNINDPMGAGVGTLNFDGGTIVATNVNRAAGGVMNWTDGTLRINGGTINNASANLTINGAASGDLPTLQLAGGASGTGFAGTTLTVGSNHAGALELTGGSVLQVTNAFIGSQDGGDGRVTLLNGTLNALNGQLAVGGTNTAAGGLGELNIGAGATAAASTFRLWEGGSVTLDGGTLTTFVFNADGGEFQFDAGTIQFIAAFVAGDFSSVYDTILGPEHRLLPGRTITYNGTFNPVNMALRIDGGNFSTATDFNVGSGSILEVSAGKVSAGTLTNDANAQVYVAAGDLSLTTTFTNAGELRLAATSDFNLISGTTLINTGLVHGNGRINMGLTNNSGGQVRAAAGDHLVFGGAATNNGTGQIQVSQGGDLEFKSTLANNSSVDVIGGTLRVQGAATNASTGFITGRDATLRFNGGLSNDGRLGLSFGRSDVFGAVANNFAGRVIVSGNSEATFYGDVVNNGIIQVSAGSTAVYFGNVSGAGIYAGAGTNFYEGGFSPGLSPARVTFGGDVAFGSASTLTMEIAGLIAGDEYDQLVIGGTMFADGRLTITLLSGFVPEVGDSFLLFDAADFSGDFNSIQVPTLSGGKSWDVSGLTTDGLVIVIPEPSTVALLTMALLILGAGLIAWRRRPR